MLLRSAGWERFRQFVAKEWGSDEGGGAAFVSAVQKAANGADADALSHLRQIVCAQREIQKVMRWPEGRLQMLTQHPAQDSTAERHPSRRGSL